MTFTIARLEEKDALRWSQIHYEAFVQFLDVLWNAVPSEESLEFHAQQRAEWLSKPDTHVIKAIDTESGKIAGVAAWNIYPNERTTEEFEQSLVDSPVYPEINAEARSAFMKNIYGARRNILGTRPCVVLAVLVVSPEFQRRGVGHLLVDWGTKEMDRLGLVGYLESSINGVVLYQSHGYEKHSEFYFDKRPFGGEGIDTHTVMFRQPKPASQPAQTTNSAA